MGRAAVVAILLGLGSVPVSAQSPAAATTTATTAAQDLDCALWASVSLRNLDPEADIRIGSGLSIAMAWFIGLYEGKTGEPIDEALRARSESADPAAVQALGQPCVARLGDLSRRMSQFGI